MYSIIEGFQYDNFNMWGNYGVLEKFTSASDALSYIQSLIINSYKYDYSLPFDFNSNDYIKTEFIGNDTLNLKVNMNFQSNLNRGDIIVMVIGVQNLGYFFNFNMVYNPPNNTESGMSLNNYINSKFPNPNVGQFKTFSLGTYQPSDFNPSKIFFYPDSSLSMGFGVLPYEVYTSTTTTSTTTSAPFYTTTQQPMTTTSTTTSAPFYTTTQQPMTTSAPVYTTKYVNTPSPSEQTSVSYAPIITTTSAPFNTNTVQPLSNRPIIRPYVENSNNEKIETDSIYAPVRLNLKIGYNNK